MKDLAFILKHIENISKRPERDFAKIFEDEKQYYTLIGTLHWAFRESYKAAEKLAAEESWNFLRIVATDAGLGIPSEKKMFDREYRLDLMHRLFRKEKADGKPYREQLRLQILREKMSKRLVEDRQKLVTCPKCGLKQEPIKSVTCPKCGHKGPVIGNLYQGL